MTTQVTEQDHLDLTDWTINTENSGFDAEEVRTFLSKAMHAYIANTEHHLREKAPGKWHKPYGAATAKTFYMRMSTRGAGTKIRKWSNSSYRPSEDMIMAPRHSGMDTFTIYWFDQRVGVTEEEQMLISANRDKSLKLRPRDLKEFFIEFVRRFWSFNSYHSMLPAFDLPSDLTFTWRWPKIDRTERAVDKIRAERIGHIKKNFKEAEGSIRQIRYQRTTARQETMQYIDTILTHLNRDKNNMDVEPIKAEIQALTAEVIKMTDAVEELCTNLEKRIAQQGENIKNQMEK